MTDQQTGSYWASIIGAMEDDEDMLWRDDSATVNAENLSHDLGKIRRLQLKVADYLRLERAELDRLEQMREAMIGPLIRQIARLEDSCADFARRAFEDFGKTTHQTPNGLVKVGRARVDDLKVDDEKVAAWLRDLTPGSVTDRPKVSVESLRDTLRVYETEAGVFERWVDTGPGLTTFKVHGLTTDLTGWGEKWRGFYKALDPDTNEWAELPGVTWTPQPRKITVVAA